MQGTYFAAPKEQLTLQPAVEVALSGDEIRSRLAAFAARWSVYEGSERRRLTFLNELFECYGQRRSDVARFEEPQAGRFLDLIWPRVCLIEMKPWLNHPITAGDVPYDPFAYLL